MARYQNPFVQGPWNSGPSIGAGLNSWAKVLAPDAGDLASIASARLSGARADQVQRQTEGWQGLAGIIRSAQANPDGYRNILAGLAGTMEPGSLNAAGNFLRAYGFSQGASGAEGDRLMMGAGQGYGDTSAGFAQTDATRRRGQDVSAGASITGARIGADADIQRETLRQAGEDRRFSVNTPAGATTTVPDSSPVANRATNGVIQGVPTLSTVQGQAAGQIVANPNISPADERRLRGVLPGAPAAQIRAEDDTPRGTVAATARPVPAAVSKRIAEAVASPTEEAGNVYQYDSETQRWMRARAEELYQNGPDGVRGSIENALEEARAEFMQAGPGRGDSTWNPLSTRVYTLPQSLRRPAPNAPPQPPAAGAQSMQRLPPAQTEPRAPNLAPPAATLAPPGRASPAAQQQMFRLTPAEAAQALAEARDAIARGAPRDVVIQRLRGSGIDPSGL